MLYLTLRNLRELAEQLNCLESGSAISMYINNRKGRLKQLRVKANKEEVEEG